MTNITKHIEEYFININGFKATKANSLYAEISKNFQFSLRSYY